MPPTETDRVLLEKIEHLAEDVRQIKELLITGNGKPSLLVRMDRLEQWSSSRKWIERTVIGSIVVLLVGAAVALLKTLI